MDNLISLLQKERLLRGQEKYGQIHLESDPRNFVQESIEEVLDSLNYLQWASEKGQLPPDLYQKIAQLLKGALVFLLSAQA